MLYEIIVLLLEIAEQNKGGWEKIKKKEEKNRSKIIKNMQKYSDNKKNNRKGPSTTEMPKAK